LQIRKLSEVSILSLFIRTKNAFECSIFFAIMTPIQSFVCLYAVYFRLSHLASIIQIASTWFDRCASWASMSVWRALDAMELQTRTQTVMQKKKKIPFSLSIPFIHVLSMRSRMILCSVSEELFWSNYFAHVELLLQANETPSTSIAVSTVSVQPSTSLGTKNSTNLGSTSNAETSKHVNILSDTLSTNLVPASTSPIDTKTAIENLSLSANAFLAPDSTYLQVRPFCFSSNCIIILIIFS
jgi:hypothetical protein